MCTFHLILLANQIAPSFTILAATWLEKCQYTNIQTSLRDVYICKKICCLSIAIFCHRTKRVVAVETTPVVLEYVLLFLSCLKLFFNPYFLSQDQARCCRRNHPCRHGVCVPFCTKNRTCYFNTPLFPPEPSESLPWKPLPSLWCQTSQSLFCCPKSKSDMSPQVLSEELLQIYLPKT